MINSGLVVFAYNFPHKKTQDFLFRLFVAGIRPAIIIAADYVTLKISVPTLRVKPRHMDTIHPREIAKIFDIDYLVADHNGNLCFDVLKSCKRDIGLISGARILEEKIINLFHKGIVNIHPGLLPEGRGMDALQWSIYEGRQLGVTAHVINRKIDHGRIIKKVVIPEFADDTLIDLSLRLEQAQNNIVCDAIQLLYEREISSFEAIGNEFLLHKKMPKEIEDVLPELFLKRKLLLQK